jgi:hypothetical protein
MTDNLQHLLAASALITHCERLCRSGRLAEVDELGLRAIVSKTRTAFSLGLPGERCNDNTTLPDLDSQLCAVSAEINSESISSETLGA